MLLPAHEIVRRLESYAHAQFDLSRGVDLAFECTEISVITQSVEWIKKLVVVEYVRKDSPDRIQGIEQNPACQSKGRAFSARPLS